MQPNPQPSAPRPTPNPPSDFHWEIDEATGGGAIKGLTVKKVKTLVVPNEIDGRPVTKIADQAFVAVKTLTSVALPSTLQTIGKQAFWGCASLQTIEFPEGLQTIGETAFWFCESLTSVAFPNSLLTIGDYAFYSCKSLTSATFGDGLQTVGKNAFSGCPSLPTLQLPEGATTANGATTVGGEKPSRLAVGLRAGFGVLCVYFGAFCYQQCRDSNSFSYRDFHIQPVSTSEIDAASPQFAPTPLNNANDAVSQEDENNAARDVAPPATYSL